MEINKCEDLKNFFVSDNFMFKHRGIIAVAVAILVFLIIRRLDKNKEKRTILHAIIALVAGYLYYIFIGKLLNSVQNASLNEDEKMVKEGIVDNMVENCKVVLEQPFM